MPPKTKHTQHTDKRHTGDMKNTMQNIVNDVSTVTAKVAGGFVVFGLTPADYAGLATALYFFTQAGYLVWKWRKEIKSNVAQK